MYPAANSESFFAEDFDEWKAAHTDCVTRSSVQAVFQKKKDELARVKLELEQVKKAKTVMETELTEELRLQAGRLKEVQDKLDEDSARATSLEQQVETLKAKPAEWLRELRWINEQMAGESSLWVFSPVFFYEYLFSDSVGLTWP